MLLKQIDKWDLLRRKIVTSIRSLGVSMILRGLYFNALRAYRARLVGIEVTEPGVCVSIVIRMGNGTVRTIDLRKVGNGSETFLIGETPLPSDLNVETGCRMLSLLSETGYPDYTLHRRCNELWLTYARRVPNLSDRREIYRQLLGLADTADRLCSLVPE
jgi:hypothetical protein